MRELIGSDLAGRMAQRFMGQPVPNNETGMVATISSATLGKLTSGAAARGSVMSRAHIMDVANIDRLLPIATLLLARHDADESPGTRA
jgi:hypothetical protein